MSECYLTDAVNEVADPQRMRALGRANEIRLARAELKRRIAYGEVSVVDVLLDVPDHAANWAISDLLMSQRRWGESKCRKFLWRNRINETKCVGALTQRQRLILAEQLESRHSRELTLV